MSATSSSGTALRGRISGLLERSDPRWARLRQTVANRIPSAVHNGGFAPSRGPLSDSEVERFFAEGFLVKERMFTTAELDVVNEAVERCWRDKSIYNNATISAFTSSPRYTETYVRNVDGSARNEPYKLNHLYLHDAATLLLIMRSPIQAIARQLLDGTPLLFNGLNMEWGTEQRFHFDTFYMPPRVKDKMVVAWVALEDIQPGSGALRYYPRSHLIPPYIFSNGGMSAIGSEMPDFDRYIERELEERGLEWTQFHPKAGDVFFWHSQLYHGGSPIEDRSLHRRSMVTHFWRAEDMPTEMCLRVDDGSYILAPECMPVAPNFDPNPQ